jgi:group II intron reverse transcriptase/maturase
MKPDEEKTRVETKLAHLSKRAAEDPECKFTNLMHMVNEGTLEADYRKLGRNRATGVDGVSWEEYGKQLRKKLAGVVKRMKTMSYRPQAVRRVYIPKGNGEQRPIGIPATEDKVVQKVMSRIMEAIWEADFLENSYGFRPGKNCHQALKKVGELIKWRPINHVIEADIKGYFDRVPHQKLMEMISRRISDKTFKRYIVRFLKSGYLEGEVYEETEIGTPQGGNISPLLANIYLHYVVDEWFEKEVKPRLKGEAHLVRYCDDFIILVRYKPEAGLIKAALEQRFREYELELHPEKTKVISFGRYERENARSQSRRANTFDFLGITHYCDVSRGGKFKVGRRTSRKRFQRSCREMNQWLKKVRSQKKTKEWWQILKLKVRGHYQYYGMSENYRGIMKFYRTVVKLVFKWLNRRRQRGGMKWEQYNQCQLWYPIPKPRIVHSFYKVAA